MLVTSKRVIILVLLIGFCLPACALSSAAAPRRYFVAGSEQMLWLTVAQWDQKPEDLVNQFFYRERDSDRVRASHAIPPQLQEIRACAVSGQTLDVFFVDGAHYRYDLRRKWRAHALPGQALPHALAGEQRGSQPLLWALVDAKVAREIEAQARARKLATAPAAEPVVGESPPAMSEPVDRTPAIVMYDGTAWQPGIPAPPDAGSGDGAWLAIADERFHLFWTLPGQEATLHYARFEAGGWTAGPTIAASLSVYRGAAAVVNKQLVFAALLKAPDDRNRRCMQWTRPAFASAQDAWNHPAPLLDYEGKELVLTTTTALGLFSDRLVLLRQTEKGAEAGFWATATGGKPDQPFQLLPAAPALEGPTSTRGVRDLAVTIVVAAMLLLVFWRRQESNAAPLALPPGLQVAGPAKRMAAFTVDALPAAILVFWLWYDPIMSFYHEVNAASASGQDHAVDPPQSVIWAWFWFRVIYTSYCTLFELWLAATPGKRLLGCRVLSETLEKAGPMQIAIRNVARMIELEPFLKIWPFMIVAFITRNRQRMGDLLARTIVVERQTMVLSDTPTGDPPEDEHPSGDR